AQCQTCNQPVTAYYGAPAAPMASPCATGACDPLVVNAYRPAYQPLFTRSANRQYDRLMRRWNRFWARNEPAPMAQPIAMTVGYGSTCSPCATSCATTCYKPQQSCRYVPQTCYRTEYCNVPVTTYRPVTTCDPCTGCTTTCMKPCTTYQRQARQVPYTAYRMVCETRYAPVVSCQPASCAPCGSPCGTAACAGGDCLTGNCATGNCASGNCASGNCATVSGTVGAQPAAPSLPGQSTPQPTLSPSAIEANKPSAEVDIEIKPEVEIQPMRDLEQRHQPYLEGESASGDRVATLDVAPATVSTVSHGGWRASSR
ncbi:MAG: hypothetical protein VXZ84_08730, partial [Planctomycetota bacterium]|nr:hypothetical protein [Planctomycetota bacterium]